MSRNTRTFLPFPSAHTGHYSNRHQNSPGHTTVDLINQNQTSNNTQSIFLKHENMGVREAHQLTMWHFNNRETVALPLDQFFCQ